MHAQPARPGSAAARGLAPGAHRSRRTPDLAVPDLARVPAGRGELGEQRLRLAARARRRALAAVDLQDGEQLLVHVRSHRAPVAAHVHVGALLEQQLLDAGRGADEQVLHVVDVEAAAAPLARRRAVPGVAREGGVQLRERPVALHLLQLVGEEEVAHLVLAAEEEVRMPRGLLRPVRLGCLRAHELSPVLQEGEEGRHARARPHHQDGRAQLRGQAQLVARRPAAVDAHGRLHPAAGRDELLARVSQHP
mmetsp:Transcript_7182/g.17559  ORF Transcript_7182/g.17559 Transcript_7182/m.17559 type:complete len:250 (+) Transcript_7182:567-1316(+)